MFTKTPQIRPILWCALIFAFAPAAHALPRDAQAVLNRCGDPFRGDETILENSISGGRRILHYERAILHFDKVAAAGWTFTYGEHGKQTNLDAQAMSAYMPCLKDALQDSAAAGPLVPITSLNRVEVSMKRSLQEIILYSIGFLVLLGIFFALWDRRPTHDEDLVG